MAFRGYVALSIGALLVLQVMLASADPFTQDAQAAKAFCNSPQFKAVTCGWASSAEEKQTTTNQCPFCGTFWGAEVPSALPAQLTSNPNYFQESGRIPSLACQGRVVVRSVFQVQGQPADQQGCAYAYLDSSNELASAKATPVVRCELQLPSGPGTEAQRALSAKETNCFTCTRCSDGGGCPAVNGRWYSDSFTTSREGCASKFSGGYMARPVGIGLNAPASLTLAKFEVCNSASCFNPQYEATKLNTAKKCKNGVC